VQRYNFFGYYQVVDNFFQKKTYKRYQI